METLSTHPQKNQDIIPNTPAELDELWGGTEAPVEFVPDGSTEAPATRGAATAAELQDGFTSPVDAEADQQTMSATVVGAGEGPTLDIPEMSYREEGLAVPDRSGESVSRSSIPAVGRLALKVAQRDVEVVYNQSRPTTTGPTPLEVPER